MGNSNQQVAAVDPADEFANSAVVHPDDVFTAAAEKYGRGDTHTFASLLRGIYKVESNDGKNIDHRDPVTGLPSGAAGPMGLMPPVQKMFGVTDPRDFGQSVNAAAQYLAKGYDETGSLTGALRFYHGGPNRRLWGQYTNAYPQQVTGAAQVPITAVSAVKAPVKNSDVDDFVNSVKLPSFALDTDKVPEAQQPMKVGTTATTAPAPVAAKPTTAVPFGPWSAEKEIANAGLVGYGPVVQGAASWLGGGEYNKTVEEEENARREWMQEHPGTGLAADLFGALPATVSGEALAAKGIAAGGRLLARAVPKLGPALTATGRFLGGVTGAGKTGASGIALRAGSRATSGALQGAGIGAIQSNLYDHPLGDQILTGLETGAVLNPLLAPVGEGISSLFGKGNFAPQSAVDPAVKKTAEDAEKLGLSLRGGQIAQDARVQALDAKHVPAEVHMQQVADLHRAVGKTFGVDTDRFTPEVLSTARKRIGTTLDALGAKYDTPFSGKGLTDLGQFKTSVDSDVDLNDASRKLITDAYNELTDHIAKNGGTLSGKTYGSMTQGGGPLSQLVYNKNDTVRAYGEQLRDLIDNEVSSANPSIPSAWKAARAEWRNLRVAENWVKGSATGQGDPQKLISAAQRSYPAIASTDTDIGTLARAGKLMNTSTVTAQGGVKPKGNPLSVMLEHPLHGALGLGAIGAGFEGAKELLPLIQEHPFATSASIVSGLAAKGMSAVAKRKLQSDLLSKEYSTRLLHGADGKDYFINPLLPLMPRSTDTYEEPRK